MSTTQQTIEGTHCEINKLDEMNRNNEQEMTEVGVKVNDEEKIQTETIKRINDENDNKEVLK